MDCYSEEKKGGSLDFYTRDWVEYEDGFGNFHSEFWIGLRSMHCLTSQGHWELRIDYHLKNGTKPYLHYNRFAIGPAKDQYPLNISGFDSVGLTDPFNVSRWQVQNGRKFTSCDRDNDVHRRSNCAIFYGGFWHSDCGGLHINDGPTDSSALYLNGHWHNPTLIEMKVRPKNCDMA